MNSSFTAALRTVAMKIATTFYRRMFAFASPLDLPVPEPGPGRPVVTRLVEAQITEYCRLRPQQPPDLVCARLAAGHECFLVWQSGELVHAGWMAAGRVLVPYLNRDIVLDLHDVYTYDIFTRPGRRGCGYASLRFRHARAHYWARGYRRAFSLVAVENQGGLAVTLQGEGRFMGVYRAVRIGPWQNVWSRPVGGEKLPQLLAPTGPA